MDTDSINFEKLNNDFRQLGRLDNVNYQINEQGTQVIEIKHSDNFLIKIVIPDGIFEWFIDIFDNNSNKLVSDWYDGYGEPEEILKAYRQKDVEDTVHKILDNKLRYVTKRTRFKVIYTIEIFTDSVWTELISDSKIKLW